ncbi:MAG TPA: putative lipid II flippase FtsW [Spirochaetota bacterium]|nr:putative lipid II flippase FtsW [Spirochaetota bacterium]OPZ38008.1 MAG: Lipid II flippase FtsW [Spirochaetes bacterium ADurb.BinA120]HNU92412.1 putative lipid II flippase FtsW [Spirochaetota bacterium]HPO45880.1 putative lipid II flippase FtsW [Spirochaetota bacterium]HPV98722.1 putative lipid II flippase FtsW [Spirochaetota bacterium]
MDLKSVIDTRRRGEPDMALFVIVLLLAAIGVAMSYSASAVVAARSFDDPFHFLKRQAVWFAAGFALLFMVQRFDYRNYARHTKIMLLVSLVLLVLVLIPGIGHSVKGSTRWLGGGTLAFQPSEFVKIFVVIYLAKVFSSEPEGRGNQVVQLLVPVLVVALIFILAMMQPDFGTAIDILLVAVFVLFVSGFPFFYIAALFVVSIPMFYLLVYQVGYRKDRMLAFLDPWRDPYGTGYHVIQSIAAFRRGGFFGVGLGYGTQKIKRLPEPHTDFVFSVIAEEAGLLGTVLVLGLFCALFYKGMRIAQGAPDEFGRLLAMGLTLLVVLQAFLNFGVVTGSLPTTGIPLPFISYGGSSLLSSLAAMGILLNISRYREVVQEGLKLSEEVWR